MAHWIRATYPNVDEANRAIDRVSELGYGSRDISIVMSPQTRDLLDRKMGDGTGSDAGHIGRAATGGGVIGAVLGGILATTTATGAAAATVLTGGLAAPFVAGPLAAALAGLAGGSAIGALVGAAGWEEERDSIEHDIGNGGVIVGVDARSEDDVAVEQALRGDDPSAAGFNDAIFER